MCQVIFCASFNSAGRIVIPGVVEGFTLAGTRQAFELEITIASSSLGKISAKAHGGCLRAATAEYGPRD